MVVQDEAAVRYAIKYLRKRGYRLGCDCVDYEHWKKGREPKYAMLFPDGTVWMNDETGEYSKVELMPERIAGDGK